MSVVVVWQAVGVGRGHRAHVGAFAQVLLEFGDDVLAVGELAQ